MNQLPEILAKTRRFLTHDVWNTELSSISGIKRLLIRSARVSHLVMKGTREDDLPVHAAALTFSTLMALVPLLAIAFSVLKGLGAEQEPGQADWIHGLHAGAVPELRPANPGYRGPH